MQRLIDLFRGRLSGERGATAVVFALLLVPMLGFAAIAVDIGSLYAERARLQVAADAAAIAVAQDCSRGNCGDMLATARAMVVANDGDASAAQPVLNSDPLSVTVTGRTPVQHWFAPVIGHDSTGGLRVGDRRLGCAQPRHRRPAADLLLVRVLAEDRRRRAVGHDAPARSTSPRPPARPAAPGRRTTSSRAASPT